MCWSAAARAKSLTGWRTIPVRDCRNGAFARSSSGPRATASWPKRSGCAPDIPARLFRDLLLQATALVRQRLLASAAPAMQAEIRRLLAKDLQPTGATSAPPDYATAQRTIEALREGRMLE